MPGWMRKRWSARITSPFLRGRSPGLSSTATQVASDMEAEMGTAKSSVRSAIVFSLALTFLLSGCHLLVGQIVVVVPSTVEVPLPPARPAPAKAFVRLVEVKDVRRFDALARSSSAPSLQNADQINDRSITARAIGRKWDGTQQVGDILLPEGSTVEHLIRGAVTIALGQQGYAVVDATSPEFGIALPLHVEIHQFWGWISGRLMLSIEFESIVVLKGASLAGGEEQRVRGYGKNPGPYHRIAISQFRDTVEWGIADLIESMKATVKRPD